MKIHLTAVHFVADQKLVDYIDKKTSKLSQFFDRITDVQVFLKLENSGQVRDKIVELKLMVPGDTLVAKETSKTFEAATDAAVDNMKRQLSKHKERVQKKAHSSKTSST
ncbi:MAG: ribosome-associated translation inhibitor RaiA [Saprospiraceae bacterium]|mgnify:FL=1|nr:ribosome-associated translation inhibitor RaiA [Saprospiraceae bacterium]